MNKKKKLKFYGAGRMGGEPRDKEWRNEITPYINKLGKFWNPYLLEPKQLRGLQPNRLPQKTPDGKKITHWWDLKFFPRDSREYARFKRYMNAIITFDLNLVKKADVILVRWSDGCRFGAGTHGEVTVAKDLNKPIYCFDESKEGIPDWIQGCCTEIFDSMKELLAFLFDEYGEPEEKIDLSKELIN